MIEVEIKVKVEDPHQMRKLFSEHNGEYKISLQHEDTYLNMPKELRDFKKTDEALRIRKSVGYNKEEEEPKQKIKYQLTYKGPKMDKTTKTRKELEVELQDGQTARVIFKALGFLELFTVKKERELYEFTFQDQKIEALIDYIPVLGEYFIEVECMVRDKGKINELTALLFQFLNQFNIKREQSIQKSYLELIADKFKQKSRKRSH